MQNYIDIISSGYLFAFLIQMTLLGFRYHNMIHPRLVKAITTIHATFLMTSVMAMLFDGFKNAYMITGIVALIGFVIGVGNDKEDI